MRIYLIGFMGSGKTTLGSAAADALSVPFLDTDQVIESQAGMSITQLFSQYGEHYFRQMEADVLRQTAFYDKAIISTGGGLPIFEDNMPWMQQNGITVYLQWPDDWLVKNLEDQNQSRPLLEGLQKSDVRKKVLELLAFRKPRYEQAAITAEMSGVIEEDLLRLQQICKYIW